MHIHFVHIISALFSAGAPAAIWNHYRQAKLVRAAEARVSAAESSSSKQVKADENKVRAVVSADLHAMLNRLRIDADSASQHPFAIIERVRAEIRKLV
jgi:predicted component of type VI protein secretion system